MIANLQRTIGFGAGFLPKKLERALIDETLTIGNDTAFKMAREAEARPVYVVFSENPDNPELLRQAPDNLQTIADGQA